MSVQFMDVVHLDLMIGIGKSIPLSNSLSKNHQQIVAFWQTFNQTLYRRHMKLTNPWVKYGCTFYHKGSYHYACAIPSSGQYPIDFTLFKIDRHDYVRFLHTGSMDTLPTSLQWIWNTYLPDNKYIPIREGLLYFERYSDTFHFQKAHSQIEILVPIQKAPQPFPMISAKTILQGHASKIQTGYQAMSWFGMDFNMNLYKGCCHGCIYCDSRSQCYQVQDFDIVRGKTNELMILQQELKRRKRKGVIGIGAMSDTYNPFEREQQITRNALKLIAQYGYGVGIDTKSDLILRDIDLLKQITKQYPSIVKVTITCADDALSSILEPHVVSSSKRFKILQRMHEEGIYAGILLMPILPFINDTEDNIRAIVELAHQHHAAFIYAYEGFGVTLRENQRDYFYYQLDQYFPGKREQYEKYYHNTYNCISPHARKLKKIFQQECERYGIRYRMQDIIKGYKSIIPNQQIQFDF